MSDPLCFVRLMPRKLMSEETRECDGDLWVASGYPLSALPANLVKCEKHAQLAMKIFPTGIRYEPLGTREVVTIGR